MKRYELLSLAMVGFAFVGTALAQDEEAKTNEPDPKLDDDTRAFLEVVMDRKMERDGEALPFLSKWLEAYEAMHVKDKKSVLETVDKVFSRAKVRPPEQLELYTAAAVALGRMGEQASGVLKKAFTSSRFRKPEYAPLRSRLILSMGQTKDERQWKFVLDTALTDPEDQIMAKAGEALAYYAELDIKDRREIVKKLVKRFNEIHDASRTLDTGDAIAETKRRTYAAISDPWNTTLAKLTGQNFRTPQDWQHWWNKSKNDDWEKSGD